MTLNVEIIHENELGCRLKVKNINVIYYFQMKLKVVEAFKIFNVIVYLIIFPFEVSQEIISSVAYINDDNM